jgi:catechol 2,3-dioxygenase-like lactoylglutathione lyase family enzyme
MAKVSVHYIVDDVDAAIEFYTKLTELASVRYRIDDARASVDFYTTHLGFTINPTDGVITNG